MRYILILLTLTILSCKKENPEPKINIYLLCHFVNDMAQKFASAGSGAEFEASPEDLQDEPFITNDEILAADIKNRKIVFSKSASEKILGLEKSFISGKQYAITVNDKIVSCGYFWSNLSSTYPYYNSIFPPMDSEVNEKYTIKDSTYFDLFHLKKSSIMLPDELVDAFRKTGRLMQ